MCMPAERNRRVAHSTHGAASLAAPRARQVRSLQALGVAAEALTSLTPKEEVNSIYARMAPGGGPLVLLTQSARLPEADSTSLGRVRQSCDRSTRLCPHASCTARAAAARLPPGGGLRLMYCTPEKIANSKRFLAKLEKL